jgi:hypothetical protein
MSLSLLLTLVLISVVTRSGKPINVDELLERRIKKDLGKRPAEVAPPAPASAPSVKRTKVWATKGSTGPPSPRERYCCEILIPAGSSSSEMEPLAERLEPLLFAKDAATLHDKCQEKLFLDGYSPVLQVEFVICLFDCFVTLLNCISCGIFCFGRISNFWCTCDGSRRRERRKWSR